MYYQTIVLILLCFDSKILVGDFMIKRIVIAGCRNYTDYEEAKKYIDFCIKDIRKKYTLIFISGDCKGADKLGEKYAIENRFNIEKFPANWNKYGKSAGPKRNEIMAQKADYIICFWDKQSKGTKSMIYYAKKYNKPLRIKIISNSN